MRDDRGRPRSPRLLLAGVLVAVLAGLGVALAATGPGARTALPGVAREPAPQVAGFVFEDHSGPGDAVEVELVPPAGGLTLLSFGYLSCPDVCPMTMADLALARRELGDELAARTTVAFVTVDPERDDGARIRAYLEHFFDDGFLALTAPDERALRAVADHLGVRYEVEAHAPGEDRYEVAHSAATFVVDDRGEVVRELPFGTSASDVARVVRALLPPLP